MVTVSHISNGNRPKHRVVINELGFSERLATKIGQEQAGI